MEWKIVKLGDILKITGGQLYKGDLLGSGDNLLLGMGCVSFLEKFLLKGARQYGGDCLDKNIGRPGDIVLATRQQSDNLPILAMPAIIPEGLPARKIIIGSNLYKVNVTDPDFNNRFIYWLLKTPEYVNYISSVKTGTTVKMITIKDVESYTFLCPPKESRDKISKFLWNLDDKIENNNRINRNLEEQAQALFKSWFVDFEPWGGTMPEDWKFGSISAFPHILETGRRPKGGAVESGVPSIGAEHIKGMGTYDYSKTKYITEEYARSMKTGKIKGYELLIYKDGGKPGYFIPNCTIDGDGYPFDECYINEHVLKLDFPNKAYNIFCYFYFQEPEIMTYLNAQGGKAAIPGINKSDIENISILSPKNEAVKQFGDIVMPYFTTILRNLKENQRLAALRDTLLPKLMKGEIEV